MLLTKIDIKHLFLAMKKKQHLILCQRVFLNNRHFDWLPRYFPKLMNIHKKATFCKTVVPGVMNDVLHDGLHLAGQGCVRLAMAKRFLKADMESSLQADLILCFVQISKGIFSGMVAFS